MKRFSQIIALAAMTSSLSIAAWADSPPAANSPEAGAQMNSLRMVRDPGTGEMRAPTTEELKGLLEAERQARAAQASSRSARSTTRTILPAEKKVVKHKNGMVSVKLGQDSLTAIKAETTPDGVRVVHVKPEAPIRMEK
jgi:hypothetical protein